MTRNTLIAPIFSRLIALFFVVLLAVVAVPARAQGVQLEELKAVREEGALVVSVQLRLALPGVVRDALQRGVPVFFEAEAEVRRQHRYWFSRRQARAHRYMRLAYQPLTRHWLLATSSKPLGEGQRGWGLARTFDSLDEALAAAGRMARWQVASAAQLARGGRQALRFTFRLDTSRLPAAIQIGAMGPGKSGWTLAVQREIPLGRAPRLAPASAPPSAPDAAQADDAAPEAARHD